MLWIALIGGGYFILKPLINKLTGADKKAALDEFNNGEEWNVDFGALNDKIKLGAAIRAGVPYSTYANNLINYLDTSPNASDFNNVFNIISKMRSKSELSWLSRTYKALNTKSYTLSQDLIGQTFGHGLSWEQNKKITDFAKQLKRLL